MECGKRAYRSLLWIFPLAIATMLNAPNMDMPTYFLLHPLTALRGTHAHWLEESLPKLALQMKQGKGIRLFSFTLSTLANNLLYLVIGPRLALVYESKLSHIGSKVFIQAMLPLEMAVNSSKITSNSNPQDAKEKRWLRGVVEVISDGVFST
ncbi:hypothetical protein VNO77_07828 [Canavalia gladiata]|uniref:Uncharacterized protein n=1 Tax=Canavalia gladiata TaxID=3824 RepID=A0AAN9MEP9_CANGL